MKLLVVAALLAAASATVVDDDVLAGGVVDRVVDRVVVGGVNDRVVDDVVNIMDVIKTGTLVTVDVKTKEICLLKLLNHILQPTIYDDVREIAREWVLEDNVDKYVKVDVVKRFLEVYRVGMLPRGEVFVHTNEKQLDEAVRVFRMLYFAKDFDVFVRTACWLRERINGGMFVYALTVAVFHRQDCRGIVLPAPYEIYPYFFVDSHVINKAMLMKMTRAGLDPVIKDYYGIKVTDNNVVVIDWRKTVRNTLTEADKISYFTEDIDLNTYMYYLHMNFPFWLNDDLYSVNKERRGEVVMYAYMQLLARKRLERLARGMCDIKMLDWNEPMRTGYWPKLRLHNGEEMPVRRNNVVLVTKDNVKDKLIIDDLEKIIREGIIRGKIELRDGTVLVLRKAEDIEYLCRLVLGGIGIKNDNAKVYNLMNLFKRMLTYSQYNVDKYTYVPTALDMYTTCLRDPLFWKLMKRVVNIFVLFKKMLPVYTRDVLDFPGVKVERVVTDKLVTFMDDYDVDITNAMYLDKVEMQKKRADNVFVARTRRLNNHPFKVTVDVVSDKAVDAVVRVFIGPKFDCMGRLISLNDVRLDMVEIDSFIYKLDTGKNTIVRNSLEMHGVIDQRPWTRRVLDRTVETMGVGVKLLDSWWYKTRMGFPSRLLLPLGKRGGLLLQMYVIVTPVRAGMVLPLIDMSVAKDRRTCYYTTCLDTMPLGFPFDRPIDVSRFFTRNMKFTDIVVFRKDVMVSNMVKDMDMSEMVMKRDDMTYLDTDMMMRRTYKDVMLMSVDNMTHM